LEPSSVRAVGGEAGIDLALYSQVLRRHRRLVVAGGVLTITLAFLAYVRVSPSGLSYRSPETWSNQATLVLTQEGAPELRSVLPSGPVGGSSSLADTGRFASLIDVYAALATGDAVVQTLRRRNLLEETDLQDGALPIAATAVSSSVNGATTPIMTITAKAASGPEATRLTLGATRTFLDVLTARQRAAKIPVKDRIQVRVLKSSEKPILVNPRSKALPILVFLAGLIATAAAAFTRDNLTRGAAIATPGLTELRSTTATDHELAKPDEPVRVNPGRGVPGSTAAQVAVSADGKDIPLEVTRSPGRPGRTLGSSQR